jgi:BASS family bile acid:Na+ symporter
MDARAGPLDRLARFIAAHFLWLLTGSYVVAAACPAPGLWIRDATFAEVFTGAVTARVSLSMLMLASLLFNAGLAVEPGKIREMLRVPRLLGAGLLANLLLPFAFLFLITRVMAGWHNADETQNILVGLALVASMPIAGSSTAWAHNADGELALSLGMVLASTLASPLTTPLTLHAAGLFASGEYARDLRELAAADTGVFLTLCVLFPSVVGVAMRRHIGDARYAAGRTRLKLANSVILLALNYANASASLPQVLASPDLDFLVATLLIVVALCVLAFATGWAIGRLSGATPSRRASLIFSLGMNNNGTGLILASMALAHHPRVMLPIIFYNLVQHLVAGVVDRLITRKPDKPDFIFASGSA